MRLYDKKWEDTNREKYGKPLLEPKVTLITELSTGFFMTSIGRSGVGLFVGSLLSSERNIVGVASGCDTEKRVLPIVVGIVYVSKNCNS